MKKHFITGLLATFAIAASAQSFTEWQNPEVNAVNRAPMHTNYFAYESADAAARGVGSVWDALSSFGDRFPHTCLQTERTCLHVFGFPLVMSIFC